jgi:hypothetical protein
MDVHIVRGGKQREEEQAAENFMLRTTLKQSRMSAHSLHCSRNNFIYFQLFFLISFILNLFS